MGLNVPFSCSLPFALPRRVVYLVGTVVTLVLLLNLFAPTALPPALSSYPHHEPDAPLWSPDKWIPPALSRPDRPAEWDENGRCVFISPYDAFTPAEKAVAEQMTLEEVSPGVVRVGNTTSTTGKPLNPIIGLIRHGERRWNDLLASQSTTFEQAVKKYEARWGRPPPKGFDDWWHFALAREVLLVDEFDAVMESLLPFYGLPIETLKKRTEEAEKIPETFTVIVHDGKVELQWNDDYSRDTWLASRGRADKQINLMEPFIGMVGDFRATYTIHDQPSILLDYARNNELVEAARKHTVSKHPNEVDRHEQNWIKACAPDSALSKGLKEELMVDTFISNHLLSMNPCHHPGLVESHGMFLEEHNEETHPKPHTKLYPIMVPSRTVLNGDIPITPYGSDDHSEDIGGDPDWGRKSGKAYWRGRTTGMDHNKERGAKWRQSHRERLHWLANDKSSQLQDVLAPVGKTGEAQVVSYPLRSLGQYYTNIKLTSGPIQCNEEDGTCDEMRDAINFAGDAPSEESNGYKYIIDVDGNAWSSRFSRLMRSASVVIKSTVFPEWNSHHLPEWFAYVPMKVDYSDLYSIIAFFRGTPSGKGAHDEVARRIAVNSQCWVERTLRQEDLEIYMFRLYLEYARLMSPDRDNGKMDFVMQDYHRDRVDDTPQAGVDVA